MRAALCGIDAYLVLNGNRIEQFVRGASNLKITTIPTATFIYKIAYKCDSVELFFAPIPFETFFVGMMAVFELDNVFVQSSQILGKDAHKLPRPPIQASEFIAFIITVAAEKLGMRKRRGSLLIR